MCIYIYREREIYIYIYIYIYVISSIMFIMSTMTIIAQHYCGMLLTRLGMGKGERVNTSAGSNS